MDFVIKFSARTATLFQTFARMPILFIFCKFYKVPSTKAANLVASFCFFQPKPLASAKARFLPPQAANLLPPLASSSRRPLVSAKARLYEVLAFIQKLTFEKKPKGSLLDKLETVWKRTEVIPANFHRPHSLEASPETCAGLKPPG